MTTNRQPSHDKLSEFLQSKLPHPQEGQSARWETSDQYQYYLLYQNYLRNMFTLLSTVIFKYRKKQVYDILQPTKKRLPNYD